MPTVSEDHAGMGGPFTLLEIKGHPRMAYLEVQHISRLIADPEDVRVLAAKYGSIRGQALTTRDSLRLIEKMLGDLCTPNSPRRSTGSRATTAGTRAASASRWPQPSQPSTYVTRTQGPQLAFARAAWAGCVAELGRSQLN